MPVFWCTTLALAALANGSGAVAVGAVPVGAPKVHITGPAAGSTTNDTTPVITGTTDPPLSEEPPLEPGLGEDVEVSIYALGGGRPAQPPLRAVPGEDGAWSATPQVPLTPGGYRVVATQKNVSGTGSDEVAFTLDTSPPTVGLSSPASGSSTTDGSVAVGGTAGTSSGDLPTIAVSLYSGEAGTVQAPLETLAVQASNGVWAGAFGGLAPGAYTVQASQRDAAGNTGTSAPATFTVSVPATPPGPIATFSWVPSTPVVGESVSLVSGSTDSASPITDFAWSLAAGGAFAAGKPVLTTSFSTPGAHLVRLRVADAAGRSSIATETVSVSARPAVFMQPFPVVRIAGAITAQGARIKLLTVQAPAGARITIRCHGGGCRTKSESRSARASNAGKHNAAAIVLSFNRFARDYHSGARLEILVLKPGEIGKYTVFKVRLHKVPVRQDACMVAADSNPISCTLS
ncbi:MAG TPA: PKD domain-containing protein [Solirubrobacteraceae bacterium]